MGGDEVTVTYPGSTVDPLDQTIQVNAYGHSVKVTDALSPELLREAVNKLRSYVAIDALVGIMDPIIFQHLDGWAMQDSHPQWAIELEKKWGLK